MPWWAVLLLTWALVVLPAAIVVGRAASLSRGRNAMEDDVLRCGVCGRRIGGWTGLDETLNVQAHVAEHHDRTISMDEALELRNHWLQIPTGTERAAE
jgi:hypothetical protein